MDDLATMAAQDASLTVKRAHTWFQNKRTRESKCKFNAIPVALDSVIAAVESGATAVSGSAPP
jgi:hypothetical protein